MYVGIKTSSGLKKDALGKINGYWAIAILTCIIYSILTLTLFSNINNLDTILTKYFPNVSFFDFYRTIIYKLSVFDSINTLYVRIIILLIDGPLLLGLSRFFLKICRKEDAQIKDLFFAFTNFKYFINALSLSLLSILFIFLWTLLFIIPGIIAALKYSMALYIMSDNPEIDAMDAINRSKDLMDGNKSRLFTLYLSFIGWSLLSMFTLGIAGIFVTPYFNTAHCEFYEELALGTFK